MVVIKLHFNIFFNFSNSIYTTIPFNNLKYACNGNKEIHTLLNKILPKKIKNFDVENCQNITVFLFKYVLKGSSKAISAILVQILLNKVFIPLIQL